jgi:hypothetical protein
MNKAKPKQLGELGISEHFRRKRSKVIYRTMTHMESQRWTAQTKRHCLNLETMKAEYIFCKEEVFPVELDIESSK